MLVDGDGDVIILPACTRYESTGGGTETSTERRVIFSPEVRGRRVGTSRPEWQVFGEAMARAFPGRAGAILFESAAAIRQEIAEAIPLYRGIERLAVQGDQFQWGGRMLFADGRFATPDGKARFTPIARTGAVAPRETRLATDIASFRVSTRRGKQFNSMVQRGIDPLTGAARDAVLMSPADIARLRLQAGQRIRLRSDSGTFTGSVRAAAIKPGNLEVHWPEGNVLLSATAIDPASMEPDYNALVTIEPLQDG